MWPPVAWLFLFGETVIQQAHGSRPAEMFATSGQQRRKQRGDGGFPCSTLVLYVHLAIAKMIV